MRRSMIQQKCWEEYNRDTYTFQTVPSLWMQCDKNKKTDFAGIMLDNAIWKCGHLYHW